MKRANLHLFWNFHLPTPAVGQNQCQKKSNRYLWYHSSKKSVWKKYCGDLCCAIGHECSLPAAWPCTAGIAGLSSFSLRAPASRKHLPNCKQKGSQLNAHPHNWVCRCSMKRRVKISCICGSLHVHLGSEKTSWDAVRFCFSFPSGHVFLYRNT